MSGGLFYKLAQNVAARRDLKASDKLVYAVIVDHIGQHDKGWPGKRSIMRKTGLADKTVCDAIKRLELGGLLIVERLGNGKSNHYKSGSGNEPVQKLNRFKNDTPGGSKSEPEAVQKVNPNQTDLLNQTHTVKTAFDEARKLYPGTKRGLDTEFQNFKRKHRDFKAVVDLLKSAIESQINHRQCMKSTRQWMPSWKNFQTWINNRCWEEEVPTPASESTEPTFQHLTPELMEQRNNAAEDMLSQLKGTG